MVECVRKEVEKESTESGRKEEKSQQKRGDTNFDEIHRTKQSAVSLIETKIVELFQVSNKANHVP